MDRMRRRLTALLLLLPGMLVKSTMAGVETFVVIDGWVMRSSDLRNAERAAKS